jgi:sporulation protein YlmC with PRC-barrel domain
MSLKNYQPVKLQYGLNRVVYGNTNVEVPDDIKLYHMKCVGTLNEIKDKSSIGNSKVVDIDGTILGDVKDVHLYYDTQGKMTIPEKRTLVELGRKGPRGTKSKKTVQLPPDVQRYISKFGGKRATTMRKRKSNKITRRRCNNKF